MFLRKIVHHLKTQNWTAVGIDLLIVVVGVFLGAQASNWNDERKVRAGEGEFLTRAASDLAIDNGILRQKIAYQRQIFDAARRADAFIEAGKPCAPGRCWRVLVDFFGASQWQQVNTSQIGMEALQASPYPYDRALKRRLIGYYRGLQISPLNQQSDYRRTLRMAIPYRAQEALWRCVVEDGPSEHLDLDCAPGVADADASAIVERLRTDRALADQLTFHLSTISRAVPSMEASVAGADGLVAELRRRAGR